MRKNETIFLCKAVMTILLIPNLLACYSAPFKPFSKPSGFYLDSSDRGKDVLTQIGDTAAAINSFKFLLQTTISRGKRVDRFRQSIIFERPRNFRIETLAPNAFYALNTLIVKADQATFLDATQKQAIVFDSADVALRQRFKLPISAENLAAFLIGRLDNITLAQLAHGEVWEVYLDYERAEYQLRNRSGDAQFILSLDTLLLKRFELRNRENGKLQLQGFYDYDSTQEAQSFPKSLHLILRDFSLTLVYKMASANTEVSESLFKAVIPGNYSQLLDGAG